MMTSNEHKSNGDSVIVESGTALYIGGNEVRITTIHSWVDLLVVLK